MLARDSHHSYRPLLILTFKILRGLHDHPAFLRTFSMVFHAISTFMLYYLAKDLTGLPDLAFEAGLLFAVHPVHVEAVTAVVNMAEPIHCLLYIAAFLLYRSGVRVSDAELAQRSRSESLAYAVYWFALVLSSILFKETGLTIVAVIMGVSVVELLSALAGSRSNNKNNNNKKKGVFMAWWRRHGMWMVLCIGTTLFYYLFRLYLANPASYSQSSSALAASSASSSGGSGVYLESSDLIRKAENPFAFLSGTERALSLMYLHYRYLKTLVWPVELCAEYSFDCIPSVASTADPRFYLALGTYVTMAGLVIIALRRALFPATASSPQEEEEGEGENDNKRKEEKKMDDDGDSQDHLKDSALVNALIWMVVPFVPASGLFLRLGTLLAERLLYVPSVGFCIAFPILLRSVFSLSFSFPFAATTKETGGVINGKRNRGSRSRTVVVVMSMLYLYKSYHQNQVWADDNTLFQESLRTCPNSAKLNLQVAKIHVNSVDVEIMQAPAGESEREKALCQQYLMTARYHVDRAKTIDPTFCDAGYQEALLQVLYHQNNTMAMEVLVENLSCVYTAHQSLALLEQLWASQLEQIDSKLQYALLKLHAEQALKGGMAVYAAQKFSIAGQGAVDQRAYLDALLLASEAEHTIDTWLASPEATREKESDAAAGGRGTGFAKALELQASILVRGAKIRRMVQISIEDGQKQIDKQRELLIQEEGDAAAAAMPASVWDHINLSPELRAQVPLAKSCLFRAIDAQQQSFRYVRERSDSDMQALQTLADMGADPDTTKQAMRLLEEILEGKIDMRAVKQLKEGGDGEAAVCLHQQAHNLVDYARLQETVNSLLPAGRFPKSKYDNQHVANMYTAAAASLIASGDGGDDYVQKARQLLLRARELGGKQAVQRMSTELPASVVDTLL
jgi:hypothetical protein